MCLQLRGLHTTHIPLINLTQNPLFQKLQMQAWLWHYDRNVWTSEFLSLWTFEFLKQPNSKKTSLKAIRLQTAECYWNLLINIYTR